MKSKLQGIMGAPVTPFDADNRVDFETFEKQIHFLIEAGGHFIAHPMHIGESLNLTVEERKDLARSLVDAAAGRVRVFVNVSTFGTGNALDLARHSESVNASGIVALSPYHWQPGPEAHIDHFMTLGGGVGIDMIAYNNPKHVQVEITRPILLELMERLPNFVALKDAKFDMNYFIHACRVTSEASPDFSVFTGIEYLLTSIPVGGSGSFSNCAEVAPRLVLDLFDACIKGDLERARPLQYKMSQLLELLQYKYPAMVKYSMGLLGRPVGGTRKPILPLKEDEKAHAGEVLEALGIFENEPWGW